MEVAVLCPKMTGHWAGCADSRARSTQKLHPQGVKGHSSCQGHGGGRNDFHPAAEPGERKCLCRKKLLDRPIQAAGCSQRTVVEDVSARPARCRRAQPEPEPETEPESHSGDDDAKNRTMSLTRA